MHEEVFLQSFYSHTSTLEFTVKYYRPVTSQTYGTRDGDGDGDGDGGGDGDGNGDGDGDDT